MSREKAPLISARTRALSEEELDLGPDLEPSTDSAALVRSLDGHLDGSSRAFSAPVPAMVPLASPPSASAGGSVYERAFGVTPHERDLDLRFNLNLDEEEDLFGPSTASDPSLSSLSSDLPPTAPPGLRLCTCFRPGAAAAADADKVMALTVVFSGHVRGRGPSRHSPLRQRKKAYQFWIFLLTFLTYVAFHAVRKAFSNAKSSIREQWGIGKPELGVLDTVFLFCYAVGLYVAGYLGDRFELRRFLSVSMLATALFVTWFGAAHDMGMGALGLLAVIWALNGVVQSGGWPGCVAVIGNWFDGVSRGQIFGLFSASAATGNIVGSLLVSLCTSLSLPIPVMFLLPSILMAVMAVLVFLLMPSRPRDVGLPEDTLEPSVELERLRDDPRESDEVVFESPGPVGSVVSPSHASSEQSRVASSPMRSESAGSLPAAESGGSGGESDRSITILAALAIPGVIAYSLAFAFTKMVNYAFTFWLPLYLSEGLLMDDSVAGLLSNLYDIGQIVGSVVAGVVSDRMGRRSPVTVLFLLIGAVLVGLYPLATSAAAVGTVMMLSGAMIGGPANLISSAISADLGTHESIRGSARALSTVAGIIDGTGSVGAALGQYLVGFISDRYGWVAVFIMLLAMLLVAVACIGRMLYKDILAMRQHAADTAQFTRLTDTKLPRPD